jgi:hypothetical protein
MCDVPRQLTADRLARSGWTRGGLAARLGLGDGHMGHPSPRVIYIYVTSKVRKIRKGTAVHAKWDILG